MDFRTSMVFLGFASIGAVYFFLYRAIFFHRLKWKMIHSIYIPIAVSIFSVFLLYSTKDLDGFGPLAGVISFMILNFPVALYLILLVVYYFIDVRKAKKSTF